VKPGLPQALLPKTRQAHVRATLRRVYRAASADAARLAYAAFEHAWGTRCPGVVTSLREGGDELLTFFRFPKAQWETLRTTNLIERLHEEFRRRVKTQGSLPSEDAALILLFWQWQPMLDPIWTTQQPIAVAILRTIFWLGFALVLLSTFLINHFELFGLRQVIGRLLHWPEAAPEFKTPLLYKQVRHPLYLGFLLAFWATPIMTAGHLLFAIATTGYILIAIQLEEHDLINLFGDRYRRYRKQVSMLIPLPGKKLVDRQIDTAAPEWKQR